MLKMFRYAKRVEILFLSERTENINKWRSISITGYAGGYQPYGDRVEDNQFSLK